MAEKEHENKLTCSFLVFVGEARFQCFGEKWREVFFENCEEKRSKLIIYALSLTSSRFLSLTHSLNTPQNCSNKSKTNKLTKVIEKKKENEKKEHSEQQTLDISKE